MRPLRLHRYARRVVPAPGAIGMPEQDRRVLALLAAPLRHGARLSDTDLDRAAVVTPADIDRGVALWDSAQEDTGLAGLLNAEEDTEGNSDTPA